MAGHRLLGRELGLIGDAIRRIGPDQVRLGRVPEHPPDVAAIGRVAAQEPMVAQGIQLAAADRGLVGEVRGVIGIDQPGASEVDALFPRQVIEERPERVIGWVRAR